MTDLVATFFDLAHRHPVTAKILSLWDDVALPDAWISGSMIAQAHWNEVYRFDLLHGIADADIIYFDPTDLSEAAEVAVKERLRRPFCDLPIRIDVKNQARVHLWYEARFGMPAARYTSSPDALETFPTTASAVAMSPGAIHAPFGLLDLMRPVVRANATQIDEAYYDQKSRRWRMFWPDLLILPWSEAVTSCRR